MANISGPIDGIVAGDKFTFEGPSVTGEATVSEDEMVGEVRGRGQAGFGGRQSFSLRRIN